MNVLPNIRIGVMAFVASVAMAAPAFSDQKLRVAIPDDTVVAVQLVAPVTSAENHVGDVFDMKTTDAVNAGGYVVIAANAPGRGHITKIDQAGGHGHPGSIEVVLDYVYSVDGLKVRLKSDPLTQEGSKSKSGATVAGIFTYGLASNAIKGGEATLATTRTLQGRVDGLVHVVSSTKAAAPNSDAGFAK